MEVDHIDPVVSPQEGFISWDVFIDRLFCEKDNLQAICHQCHQQKTKEERDAKMHKMPKRENS